MDKSVEYIRMCEKAQKYLNHKLKDGDYIIWLKSKEEGILIYGCDIYLSVENDYIWLPRQDELQEMVVDSKWGCDKWTFLLEDFYKWYGDCGFQNWTLEQLWLAFVMWKKYRKVWDGEEWIE